MIFGSGMGPTSLVTALVPGYPDSLAGTFITFTPVSGGSTITAKMIYTISGQVAGLLPSSIGTGTYAVRVTYNSQTNARENVTVVARCFDGKQQRRHVGFYDDLRGFLASRKP